MKDTIKLKQKAKKATSKNESGHNFPNLYNKQIPTIK